MLSKAVRTPGCFEQPILSEACSLVVVGYTYQVSHPFRDLVWLEGEEVSDGLSAIKNKPIG